YGKRERRAGLILVDDLRCLIQHDTQLHTHENSLRQPTGDPLRRGADQLAGVSFFGGCRASCTISRMSAKSGSFSAMPFSGVSSMCVTGCFLAFIIRSKNSGILSCGRSVDASAVLAFITSLK